MLTDHRGRPVATWDYSDDGETTQLSGSASVYNPFLYTGQELDKETGYYHLRARHYAPALGKFLARDPIGYAGGSNLYAYCAGDSINFSDPSGLLPEEDCFQKRAIRALKNALLRRGVPRAAAESGAEWILVSQAGKRLTGGLAGGPVGETLAIASLVELVGGTLGETAVEAYYAGLTSSSAEAGGAWARTTAAETGEANLVNHLHHAEAMGLEADEYALGSVKFLNRHRGSIKVDPLDPSRGTTNKTIDGVQYRMHLHMQQGAWKIGSWYTPK